MPALERLLGFFLEISVDIEEKAIELVIDEAEIKSFKGLERNLSWPCL